MDTMREIPLKQYCEEHTQNGAARAIGCTQGAVWQMLRDGREVYIVLHDDGSISSYERKELGKKDSAA